MSKTILSALLVAGLAGSALASESPLWLRNQQISPDGKNIAFTYQGDIYTVPTTGGTATRLTTHAAYDTQPIWSPDGSRIVFASDREGSFDIYTVSREGGSAKRLTFGSGKEMPIGFDPKGHILFETLGMPDVRFDQYPSSRLTQLYSLPLSGGRTKLYSSLTMQDINFNAQGDALYTDMKGYEDKWRKHHISSIARDIWLRSAGGKYTKLTSFRGEDRNALWDGKGGFYYLSEQDGTFNIYHREGSVKERNKDKQITHFKGNPVRFLSRSQGGLLCFGYDGEIYTMREGQKPQKVAIKIVNDNDLNAEIQRPLSEGIQSFVMAPKGEEYAVVMRGDVFVVNGEYSTNKRITSTAEEERDVTMSPDGKTLVYSSLRHGQWQLYKVEMPRKEDKKFAYAREVKETQLTKEREACQQPVFSPKGDEVAFLRGRSEVAVLNLKSGKIRTVVPRNTNYSYSDGDLHFEWSRNGKYILSDYQGQGGWLHNDCALYRADGSGMEVNLTESAYSDRGGRFALGDKAVIFLSDRNGYRSHGSWGATTDVYLMFLEDKAYHNFIMSKEDRALAAEDKKNEEASKPQPKKKEEQAKKEDKAQKDKKDKKGKKAEATKPQAPAKPEPPKEEEIAFNFEDRERRLIKISRAAGDIADAMISPDGKKLYYIARYESQRDLYEYDLENRSTRLMMPNVTGSFVLSADGKDIYIRNAAQIRKLGGKTYSHNLVQEWKPTAERQHIFDHVQATIRDKFYDVKLHGVDWEGYGKTYKKFLPHINNDYDLAEMLGEMLGELNASHTGATAMSYRRPSEFTGSLGAFYDEAHTGDGLKIVEILKGSPLRYGTKPIKEGMIIEAINGKLIKANEAIEPLLNNTIGKRTYLTLRNEKGERFESAVKPISQGAERSLLYERWVTQREDLVKGWSDGRVAYVHVPEMNSRTFRSIFKDLLGKYRTCESVVVDTRHNGGGWLHEDLAILLSGRKYTEMNPRGVFISDDPFMQWNKPSCVLMNEGNYSNGHGFPYVYKQLGIGKLIGTPVPGTMTAVWWERLFTGTIVYGIPQVTMSDMKGKALENQELQPDIEVYNSPEDYFSGHDRQLKRAVEEMLR